MKKLTTLIALALCLCSLVSCSAGGSKYDNSYNSSGESAPEDPGKGSYGSSSDVEISDDTTATLDDRKLIRNVNLSVETKAFDALINDLNSRTKSLGGYIEQSSVNGNSYDIEYSTRYATITCRIPSDKLDEFLASIGENCNIVSQSEQVQDVTLSYVDLESRIKALEAERDALMSLLENADTTTEILAIQNQLTDVIYRIESATASLRSLSDQVAFSTVYLSINEVKVYSDPEEPTFWEEISEGFMGSLSSLGTLLRGLCVGFIVALPYLALLALIAVGIVLLVRRSMKRKAKKQQELLNNFQNPPKA